ncbi:MAG: response regulator [Myxococcales bacterium]|nr:response regulator [Myxococcales bacterium]
MLALSVRRSGSDDSGRQHGEVAPEALIEIRVEADGVAVDPEPLRRIVEPAAMGDGPLRGTVLAHGGHIDLQRLPDRGVVVSVLLPACEAPTPAARAAPAGVQHGPGAGGRILVADDDAALRRSTVRMLQHLGYRVLVAADGAETLELLRHNLAEVSLVLLDANMPHMGGSEAFAAIRAVAPDLRVVLTSGYELGQIDPALRAQVDGFLAKPYTFHQLREALKVTPSRPAAVGGPHGAALDLEQVAAPLALCDGDGRLVAGTPAARELLAACGAEEGRVPEALWRELTAVPCGEAVTWRPEGALCLGCTRYAVGDQQMLVLMREVSGKQRVLSQKMHQTRLDATGSLVAAVAHDLRGGLSTVIFNADVLATRGADMDEATLRTLLGEIMGGAERLKVIVDGLLDFAHLHDQVQPPFAIDPILQRCMAVLRSKFRERAAELTLTHAEPGAEVRGNPLIIEQIVQNLLRNALDAGAQHICIHSEPSPDGRLRLRVHDDGTGVRPELHARIFEPFFTTKRESSGLGLATSREAAHQIGGDLVIDATDHGASFSLFLRAGGSEA